MSSNQNGDQPKIVKKSHVPSFLKNVKLKNPFKKDGQINKNAVLAGSLTAVLLLVGISALVFANNHSDAPVASTESVGTIEETPKLGAIVTYREGVLEYRKEGEQWQTAPQELTLEERMSIRTTGAASRAVVSLDDGSAFRLDANTEVELERLRTDRVVIKQESGYVYNRVTPSDSREFIVTTDTAQFESEGTAFKTAQTGDEESVEVYESKVTEVSSNTSANQGKKLYVKNNSDPSKNNQVVDIDIEALKQNEFVLWNKSLDEKDENFKNSLGFLKDLTGPEITITNPADGSTIEVAAGSTIGAVEFTGKTEAGSKLTVLSKSYAGATPVDVTVASDGSFTSGLISAPLGTSVFEFVGTDKVGNKTTKIVRLTFKTKTPIVTETQTDKITLTGKTTPEGKLEFTWTLSNVTTPKGVKLVGSESSSPNYPDNYIQYIDKGTSALIKPSAASLTSGKTYFFKVCRYSYTEEGKCDLYSNEVELTIP